MLAGVSPFWADQVGFRFFTGAFRQRFAADRADSICGLSLHHRVMSFHPVYGRSWGWMIIHTSFFRRIQSESARMEITDAGNAGAPISGVRDDDGDGRVPYICHIREPAGAAVTVLRVQKRACRR